MMGAPDTAMTTLRESGCVILATAAPAVLPDHVQRWLDDHAWRSLILPEPLQALAVICLLERGQAARAAWGLQRVDRIGLLVLEPERWPALPMLLNALRCHLPAVEIYDVRQGQVSHIGGPLRPPVAAPPAAMPPAAAHPQNRAAPPAVSSSEPAVPMMPVLNHPSIPFRPSTLMRPSLVTDASTLREPAASHAGAGPRPASSHTMPAWPDGAASEDDAAATDDEGSSRDALRITRDEIAMLLDERGEDGRP
jgi:hypothetical protein